MANKNCRFGLVPVGTVGSTPSTHRQGKYFIDAANNVDLFKGLLFKVKLDTLKLQKPT